MNINFDIKELLSHDAYKAAQDGAKQAGLPVEIFVIKQFNPSMEKTPVIREEEVVVETKKEEPPAELTEFEKLFLDNNRVYGGLHKRGGISTMEELLTKTEEDLLAIRSFGPGLLEQTIEILEENGYSLATAAADLPEEDYPEAEAKFRAIDTNARTRYEAIREIYEEEWGFDEEEARRHLKGTLNIGPNNPAYRS